MGDELKEQNTRENDNEITEDIMGAHARIYEDENDPQQQEEIYTHETEPYLAMDFIQEIKEAMVEYTRATGTSLCEFVSTDILFDFSREFDRSI